MGLMDGLGAKAKELADQNADKVEQVSDQALSAAANAVNAKTGDKFADQVSQVKQAVDEKIGDNAQ